MKEKKTHLILFLEYISTYIPLNKSMFRLVHLFITKGSAFQAKNALQKAHIVLNTKLQDNIHSHE